MGRSAEFEGGRSSIPEHVVEAARARTSRGRLMATGVWDAGDPGVRSSILKNGLRPSDPGMGRMANPDMTHGNTATFATPRLDVAERYATMPISPASLRRRPSGKPASRPGIVVLFDPDHPSVKAQGDLQPGAGGIPEQAFHGVPREAWVHWQAVGTHKRAGWNRPNPPKPSIRARALARLRAKRGESRSENFSMDHFN